MIWLICCSAAVWTGSAMWGSQEVCSNCSVSPEPPSHVDRHCCRPCTHGQTAQEETEPHVLHRRPSVILTTICAVVNVFLCAASLVYSSELGHSAHLRRWIQCCCHDGNCHDCTSMYRQACKAMKQPVSVESKWCCSSQQPTGAHINAALGRHTGVTEQATAQYKSSTYRTCDLLCNRRDTMVL